MITEAEANARSVSAYNRMHEYMNAASLLQMKRILGFGAFFTTILVAQSFDAAVIKPSDGRMGIDMRSSPGGRVVATDITLFDLIAEINQIETYKVIGGPAWLTSDRFDITATAGPGFVDESPNCQGFRPAHAANAIPLLENLLAERCSLKVHREQRPDTVSTTWFRRKAVQSSLRPLRPKTCRICALFATERTMRHGTVQRATGRR